MAHISDQFPNPKTSPISSKSVRFQRTYPNIHKVYQNELVFIQIGTSHYLTLILSVRNLFSYSGQHFSQTFSVSNFAELDLLILHQLVRDPVFSQVSGETTARSSINQRYFHPNVNSAYIKAGSTYSAYLPSLSVVTVLDLQGNHKRRA